MRLTGHKWLERRLYIVANKLLGGFNPEVQHEKFLPEPAQGLASLEFFGVGCSAFVPPYQSNTSKHCLIAVI